MSIDRQNHFQTWRDMSLAVLGAASLLAGCGPSPELSEQAQATASRQALATCPYNSIQSRVHQNVSVPWEQNISITQGLSFVVGSFQNGTGQLTSCCTSITVLGPNGYVSYPSSLDVITPPAVGTYSVISTCGDISETATVTVTPPTDTIILLNNGSMETQSSAQFGLLTGWGPSGAWAWHSQFPRNGNASLGTRFGYYSAGTQETVGQLLATVRFQANKRYTFRSYAQGGGDNTGVLPYQIGYAAIDNDINSFVPLATAPIAVGADWVLTNGVTYTAPASGGPLGKQVIIRFGKGSDGGVSDIWFDNLELRTRP
ncbi:hypothetical protein JRI60_14535 [Archangium violaceum]|uniref:hypothetical protein n=1 Tax=Archangium violaceum TaxID=83451 RepID=UPI00194F8B77|nr:hypothetical protein [Archangium violaceum]QRO00141.1 hypothetical protein JRI60_14535 [Archangium violaceum]